MDATAGPGHIRREGPDAKVPVTVKHRHRGIDTAAIYHNEETSAERSR
jgi:hypothetical protein